MAEPTDPQLECNGGPVLRGAVVAAVCGAVAVGLFNRPGWIIPISFVAGLVAGGRSGFYQPSGINGFVAAILGAVLAFLAGAGARIAYGWGDGGTTEAAFLSLAFFLWAILLYIPLIIGCGFLGGYTADFTRRRMSGRLGY